MRPGLSFLDSKLIFDEHQRNKQTELKRDRNVWVLSGTVLPSREATVDPPVITGVPSAVQLLQTHQGHVIGGQTWDAVLGSRAEVDPVKAAAADKRNCLVAVGFGVPRVATVLLRSQLLPHVAHTGGETHLGHLRRSTQQLH